jgi:hypothetical protein
MNSRACRARSETRSSRSLSKSGSFSPSNDGTATVGPCRSPGCASAARGTGPPQQRREWRSRSGGRALPRTRAMIRGVDSVGLGAEKRGGGDRKIYQPIAWLRPGHDPGAGGGVATLARQRGRFDLGTFWNKDATSGSCEARDQRRDRYVTSDATDSDAAGIDSGERGDACPAERSQLRSRKRALRERAIPVWRAGHDPGGRPGDWAGDNLPRRSRPARCRSRPAQGHGPRSRRSRRRSRHSRLRSQRPR